MDIRVEKLVSAIGKLRDFNHNQQDVIDVKNSINRIFINKATCHSFIYTINTDKLPFGCVVFPVMNSDQINNFMIVGESVNVNSYDVELDSKMFDYGLNDEEVAQMILFNVYHLLNDISAYDNIREFIDLYFTKNCTNLVIHNSVQYQAILGMGLVDALNQHTSCLNLPKDIQRDAFLDSLELDGFENMLGKVYEEIPGCESAVSRVPKLDMLEWALRVCCNIDKERIPAIRFLEKVKTLTASVLYITKFNAAIAALNRIDNENTINEAVQELFTESSHRGGLLASLKYNGLRDIETDLYEFQIRARSAEGETEVMYALKQINARLAILDDYIRQYPDDPEIERWIGVKMEYIEIRDVLAKKTLHKRSYGVFVDYNALDAMD